MFYFARYSYIIWIVEFRKKFHFSLIYRVIHRDSKVFKSSWFVRTDNIYIVNRT